MSDRMVHDEATKAAVMAALLTGQSVSSVAKEYHLPKGTVSGWRRQAEFMQLSRGVDGVATEKSEQIGDLLFDYLLANLRTLKLQAEHFGDKKWLDKQSADALAVLHGVSVDKAIRLLEALSRDTSEEGNGTYYLP